MIQRIKQRGWLVLLPTALILVMALAFTDTTSAAPWSAAPKQTAAAQDNVCATCHTTETTEWEGTSHAKAGATCESCHGEYKAGHPAAETMMLPMESDTCQTCHTAAFTQWEASGHAESGVDCFDCHLAHGQGLRTGSEETLCASCHTDRETELAHATHGIEGLKCASCHMAPMQNTDGGSAEMGKLANHDFKVGSDTCVNCHGKNIHSIDVTAKLQAQVAETDPDGLIADAQRVPELEQQINTLTSEVRQTRTSGALAAGLALGIGGFLGLVIGIAVATLVTRSR